MLREMGRYIQELFSDDFVNGFSDGLGEASDHPIIMVRALKSTVDYEKIVGEEVELERFAGGYYANPRYRMKDENVFRSGYRLGVYTGLGFVIITAGVGCLIARYGDYKGNQDWSRKRPTIPLLENLKPKETTTSDSVSTSRAKTIKFK